MGPSGEGVLAVTGKYRAAALTFRGPAVTRTQGEGEPFGEFPHLVERAVSRPDRRLVTSSKGSILEVPVCRALRGRVFGTVAPSCACPRQLPDIGFDPKHPCQARGLRERGYPSAQGAGEYHVLCLWLRYLGRSCVSVDRSSEPSARDWLPNGQLQFTRGSLLSSRRARHCGG